MPRPTLLYLVHRVPYPPNRGDRIRSYHVLRFLAQRAEVHLAFLAEEAPSDAVIANLRQHASRVAAVRLGSPLRWVRAAAGLAAGGTATQGLFASPELRRIIARWASQTRYDGALAFCSSMAPYLDAPGLAGVPGVVDLVDVDSQKWFDYAAHCRGPRRWLYRLEGRRLRRLEAGIAERGWAIAVVSDVESRIFRSFATVGRLAVIPNGVDLEFFQPQTADDRGPPRCVFTGALDYQANIDGIRWFADRVWPELQARHPELRLVLAGSRPTAAVRHLAGRPGVVLAADVPDIRPYLAQATVAVVPLRVARGIQNKVLEAMAMARPVVASPPSLEGLAAEPGRHLLRALEPEEWVAAVERLLASPALREQIGGAAREYVERQHRWSVRLAPLAALLGLSEAPSHAEAAVS